MELTRERKRPAVQSGLSAPLGVDDPAAQTAVREIHEALESLEQRLAALKTAEGAQGEGYNDTGLKRQIRLIWEAIWELRRKLNELLRQFPIVRYAVVVADRADYLECRFYHPASDRLGALVNVAKPYALRVSPWAGRTVTNFAGEDVEYEYTEYWERTETVGGDERVVELTPYWSVDEQICIARTYPGFTDAGGRVVVWEDLNLAGRDWGGGGGGFSIERVNVFPPIPDHPKIIWRNGDKQLWASGPGNAVWFALMKITSLQGLPGT